MSGRAAHYHDSRQPAEPQHTPYVRAERARGDHTAPLLHPRTRGIHAERLRSHTSDPCIPARPLTVGSAPAPDTTQAHSHDDAREVHAGRSWGGRPVRCDCPRPQRHRLDVVCSSGAQYTVFPPSETYQQHALPGGGSGLWGSSCRPSACGRRSGPVPVAYGLHGRWSVVLFVRWPQQARASVPWVAPQLEAHVQPGQLVRPLGGGPPSHAMAQHHRRVPPRTARLTRRAPTDRRAVRSSWHCCAPRGRARGRLRAGHVARVEHAETARVRLWAAPHHPAAPGRRVPLRTDRRAVRSSWALPCGEGTLSTQRTRPELQPITGGGEELSGWGRGFKPLRPSRERPRRAGPRDRRRGALPSALPHTSSIGVALALAPGAARASLGPAATFRGAKATRWAPRVRRGGARGDHALAGDVGGAGAEPARVSRSWGPRAWRWG